MPFKGSNIDDLNYYIKECGYSFRDKEKNWSTECLDLVRCLLEKDPKYRITIEEILDHDWLIDAENRVEIFTPAEK